MTNMITLLYRIYQFLMMPILFLITGIASIVIIIGCALGSAHFWGYWPAAIWARLFCRILLLPVTVQGREHLDPNTSYVYVANHQGAFDIFLTYGFLGRNFKWMMKASLRKMPLVGRACADAGHIFVDKRGPKAIKHTYDQARQVLQGGTSVVVFPEGARSYSGHMGIFRKGAFQLADELQLPVVPMTIDGSFQVLPRTRGFNFVKWHRLTLTIHAPIPPQGQGPEHQQQLLEQSYQTIMAGLPTEYQGFIQNNDQ